MPPPSLTGNTQRRDQQSASRLVAPRLHVALHTMHRIYPSQHNPSITRHLHLTQLTTHVPVKQFNDACYGHVGVPYSSHALLTRTCHVIGDGSLRAGLEVLLAERGEWSNAHAHEGADGEEGLGNGDEENGGGVLL